MQVGVGLATGREGSVEKGCVGASGMLVTRGGGVALQPFAKRHVKVCELLSVFVTLHAKK